MELSMTDVAAGLTVYSEGTSRVLQGAVRGEDGVAECLHRWNLAGLGM